MTLVAFVIISFFLYLEIQRFVLWAIWPFPGRQGSVVQNVISGKLFTLYV